MHLRQTLDGLQSKIYMARQVLNNTSPKYQNSFFKNKKSTKNKQKKKINETNEQ